MIDYSQDLSIIWRNNYGCTKQSWVRMLTWSASRHYLCCCRLDYLWLYTSQDCNLFNLKNLPLSLLSSSLYLNRKVIAFWLWLVFILQPEGGERLLFFSSTWAWYQKKIEIQKSKNAWTRHWTLRTVSTPQKLLTAFKKWSDWLSCSFLQQIIPKSVNLVGSQLFFFSCKRGHTFAPQIRFICQLNFQSAGNETCLLLVVSCALMQQMYSHEAEQKNLCVSVTVTHVTETVSSVCRPTLEPERANQKKWKTPWLIALDSCWNAWT